MSDPVETFRLYSWALETRITGPITADTIAEAALQFRRNSGARVWLLDASNATNFDMAVISAISQNVAELRPMGLDRIAVAMTPMAHPFLAMLNVAPVLVYPFGTRAEAAEWLRRGCK